MSQPQLSSALEASPMRALIGVDGPFAWMNRGMCHEDRKLKSDPKRCHMPRLNVPEFHDEICKHLDSTYRKGFAKDNPLLVGQLVIAAAIDE